MKIDLYYKDTNIGTLSYFKGVYKYNSNIDGEHDAIRKYYSLRFYDLGGRTDYTSEKIFPFFNDFLENANSDENKKKCLIFDTDTDFMKLFKYARLCQDENGYHLKQNFNH